LEVFKNETQHHSTRDWRSKSKVKWGPSTKTETKAPINNLSPLIAKLNDNIQERVRFIQEGYQNGYNIILHDLNSKKPNWLGMKASDYKANLQSLLNEYIKNPYTYGYGVVVVGKQWDLSIILCLITKFPVEYLQNSTYLEHL